MIILHLQCIRSYIYLHIKERKSAAHQFCFHSCTFGARLTHSFLYQKRALVFRLRRPPVLKQRDYETCRRAPRKPPRSPPWLRRRRRSSNWLPSRSELTAFFSLSHLVQSVWQTTRVSTVDRYQKKKEIVKQRKHRISKECKTIMTL